MKNKMEMIQQAIKEAKFFAKQNGVKLHIYEENLIDDTHIVATDYPNDTELMTMQYKGFLVNVYIGNWKSFEELNQKWIDYDIYSNISCEELINENKNIYFGGNVLLATTDIQFYMGEIDKYLETIGQIPEKQSVYLVTTIYQYDGYDGTIVYSTKEKACEAADKLVKEFKSSGFVLAELCKEVVFTRDMDGDFCYTTLMKNDGEVEISVEKKIIDEKEN